MGVESFDTLRSKLVVLDDDSLPFIIFKHLAVAFLALANFRSEFAYFFERFFFFVSFTIDSAVDLVTPD